MQVHTNTGKLLTYQNKRNKSCLPNLQNKMSQDSFNYGTPIFQLKILHLRWGVASITYTRQNGYCYYLPDRVKLTLDTSPSGIVPMQGHEGELILTCNAIANTRKTMSHDGFINLCKAIATTFA